VVGSWNHIKGTNFLSDIMDHSFLQHAVPIQAEFAIAAVSSRFAEIRV